MSESPSNPTGVLCPGQGAQSPGMGRAWAERFSVAARTYDQAEEVLGREIRRPCFEGPAEELNRTDLAQVGIYVTTVACCRALRELGELREEDLVAVAGLSLGEYTALHLAGALSFADGLWLVERRGRFMQEAAEATESGMVALLGVDEGQAAELCEAVRGSDVLVPANFNAPGQVVVSGTAAACERAMEEADRRGLRTRRLPVAGAFHSALMEPAARRLAEALGAVQWERPRVPVLANVTGAPHEGEPESIRQRLVEQLTSPVRWADNMQWLVDRYGRGGARLMEPAPGKDLTGLMRRVDRRTKVENFAEPPEGTAANQSAHR